MEASKRRVRPGSRIRTTRVVVGFDPEKLRAPFLLRCGALLIDYIFVLIAPVASLLFSKMLGNSGAMLINSAVSDTGWVIAILFAAANLLALQTFTGQSIGKMMTGIRIVKTDGNLPGAWTILFRSLVGYTVTAATFGLGFLFAAFSGKGRALHDLIAGTVVTYARRTITEKRYVKQAGDTAVSPDPVP